MAILGDNVDSLLCAVRWDDEMRFRTDSNMIKKLVDEEFFCIRWLFAFHSGCCGSLLMRLEEIANSLSSVADITSKSGLDATLLWKGQNFGFVKTSLAVLKAKVVIDSSLNDCSAPVQICCYFGEKGLVEFEAFFGASDISSLS